MSKKTDAIAAFRNAVAELKKIDNSFSLYVANDTLCLMRGDSHDANGKPMYTNIVDSESGIRISGGDW